MDSNLPASNPNALLPEQISPEGLKVTEAYIEQGWDVKKAAASLGMEQNSFLEIYKKPEVQNYISTLFMESGFRNKFKLGALSDEILNRKIEEIEESGMSSEKDIMDIISLVHKMKMEEMKMQIELEKLRNASRKTSNSIAQQTNIQINGGTKDPQYNSLIEALMGKKKGK